MVCVRVFFSPGQFLHRMGDLSAAAAQFGQAAGLAPDSYDIVYNAGNYYRYVGG